jgi:DNA-binding NarL/FixJ family response regulator
MNDKKTILIIDDHPLFREGLKSLLKKLPDYEMVGGVGTAAEGLEKVKELRPDLVVMDISLPDLNGIELTRAIRESYPDIQIAVLSMYSKISYITEAFRAGATGYLVKESATESIIECLTVVANGEYFIDPSLSHTVVECLKKSTDKEPRYGVLTPREQQVLRLIAEGLSTKEIAEKLFISVKTAENHRTNILSKLELHSTFELVRYAAKLGLIDVDLWKT